MIQRWITEPPPENLFELSENCLALGSPENPAGTWVERLGERTLKASPSSANVVRPQLVREALTRLSGPRKAWHGTAALVIPDYAVRMAVLDFEQFPAREEDRQALLRFRLKKSVPFHVDEARLGYTIQLEQPGHIEVLAIAVARPILAEYEALLTENGLRVGLVMPSCIAALPLYAASNRNLRLIAKMAGSTVSVLLLQKGKIRLLRCLNLETGEEDANETQVHSPQSVLDLLQQTLAFAEDQIGERVEQMAFCGFGTQAQSMGELAEREFQVPFEVVRSRYGAVLEENSGLLGLMEQFAA